VPGRADHLKPHGTMLGFRVYPRRWRVGMFDSVLGLPIRFVLTNTYCGTECYQQK
jgi:type IV secretion system protein VirB4